MPSRNRVKIYVKDAYYHIYNRGVAKTSIFLDIQDYKTFKKYLIEALTNDKIKKKKIKFSLRGRSFQAVPRQVKNFKDNLDLIAYCLMPNHFHFLIKQNEKNTMESFMRSVITRYVSYFNKKHDRVGPLFQGRYKAVYIDNERYLLHLSRYIHTNPSEYTKDLEKAHSSYSCYLNPEDADNKWIKAKYILDLFKSGRLRDTESYNNYRKFIDAEVNDSEQIIGELTIE